MIILRNLDLMTFNDTELKRKNTGMKTVYRITSNEHGIIVLKKRKIAKANGETFEGRGQP